MTYAIRDSARRAAHRSTGFPGFAGDFLAFQTFADLGSRYGPLR
jgi:hypothetical protein